MRSVFVFLILLFSGLNLQGQILTIKTTSTSGEWKPSRVVKTGGDLTWKATATGMTDQIVSTTTEPVFDLSVARTSEEVTITVTSNDGVSGFTELGLDNLYINYLDASGATELILLSCSTNLLTGIDITKNTKLTHFNCNFNRITALDVSKNKDLIFLSFNSNLISNIDLSNNPKLQILYAEENKLISLDLSNNLKLITLECPNNQITSLDLSLNTELESVICNINQLNNFNFQNGNNTAIIGLNTKDNPDLFCIQVDDEDYANANWIDKVDAWTSFNIDCTFTNENPAASDDYYDTQEDVALYVLSPGILENDTDPDKDSLTAVLESDVSNGTLELDANGSFTYTPNPGFFGDDSFTYRAFDSKLYSEIATVFINVEMVNEPPVAEDDTYEVNQNTVLAVPVNTGVLVNDTDPDKDELTAVLVENPNRGSLTLHPDGSFEYAPDTDFYGEDIFTYKANDGFEDSNIARVVIQVLSVSRIIVPNAFTPNGDGHNDWFKPEFIGMKTVKMQIFDTWGNLIFSEEGDHLEGWGGTVKGKAAENGNYLYVIKAVPVEDKQKELKGLFTLIR